MPDAELELNPSTLDTPAVPATQYDKVRQPKPLRLWPGITIAALQLLVMFVVPLVLPNASSLTLIGGFFGGLLIFLWWLLLSRAPWVERLGVIGLMIVLVPVTKQVVHASIAGGMMGMMIIGMAVPLLALTLVGAAIVGARLSRGYRRLLFVATIVLSCATLTLLRTGGITGDAKSDLHWRWTKTPEQRLLAQAGDEPTTPGNALVTSSSAGAMTNSSWLGFRGSKRDGIVHGVRLETDWVQKPPVALWRKPIGPGWSSFAVRDNLLYTQEQRGDDEIVSCYNLTNGQPVWRHRDAARFYESNAGAGPRGTPTLNGDRVYTFGATGILNALDARTGNVLWTRNAAADTKAKLPGWGFSGSPLVVDEVVVVATSGVLAAYDVANGNQRWLGPLGGTGYSSPHLLTIDGVTQIVLATGQGTISVAPKDGSVLWKDPWAGDGIVQPAVTADGDLLIGSGSGLNSEVGVHRIAVKHESGGWTTKERWTSSELNPYFNDFVVHKDYAFGFEGSSISCIDLKNGESKWKGGSYGHGQLVLLADQDLLLIVSEAGELALVKATPDRFTELARFKAIAGKTWNHPVLVGDTLLVRNGEEMAAFRMTLAGP